MGWRRGKGGRGRTRGTGFVRSLAAGAAAAGFAVLVAVMCCAVLCRAVAPIEPVVCAGGEDGGEINGLDWPGLQRTGVVVG